MTEQNKLVLSVNYLIESSGTMLALSLVVDGKEKESLCKSYKAQ